MNIQNTRSPIVLEDAALPENVPFFSIIIPTIGKPLLLENAIRSVLRQDFIDFELLVIDNDNSDRTRERIVQFDDPRLRYLRTGDLNMADNWQYAIERAKGRFTTVLTERMLFTHASSLRKIYDHIEAHDALIASWAWGEFDETTGQISHTPANLSHRCSLVRNDRFVEAFLMGDLDWTTYRMPKLLNACIHRNLLQEMLKTYGNVCNPCSPDYAFAFLLCLHYPQQSTLCIDETLILSSFFKTGTSNGASTGSDFTKLRSYIDSFGSRLTTEDIVNAMLLKNFTPINTLYYDLFNAARITGKTVSWQDTNLVWYFVENYRQIKKLQNNPMHADWLANFWSTLASQEPIVEQSVREQIHLLNEQRWKSNFSHRFLKRIMLRLLRIAWRILLPQRGIYIDPIPLIEGGESVNLRQYYERLFWSAGFRHDGNIQKTSIDSDKDLERM